MKDFSPHPGVRRGPGDAPVGRSLEDRIVAAAVDCIAARGVARTTLDDVARAAGCGRATIYRTFPGGKDAVVALAAATELHRLLDEVGGRMTAAATFEDAVVVALHDGYRAVAGHPALRRVLAREPELLLPHLSFQGLDRLIGVVGDTAGPALGRFVDGATARAVGEWIARIVVSRASTLTTDDTGPSGSGPSGAGLDDAVGVAPGGCATDLTDPAAVRRFVRRYLLPGVAATAAPPAVPPLAAVPASDPTQE